MARGLAVEGVFRLSGTSVHMAEFKDKLNRGEDVNWGLLQYDLWFLSTCEKFLPLLYCTLLESTVLALLSTRPLVLT